jgi:amidohydrolase/hippurate hydrolase
MATLIMEKALEIKEYVTNARRYIHENPELGFKEFNTTDFIKNELTEMGIEILPLSIPTGVVGIIKGTKLGKNVVTALRADIDALPVVEITGKPYASKNEGVMHACGHDGHTAVLLGVAKIINSMKNNFSGTVKLVFQPAEETLNGSRHIIDAGVMENPKVDNIVMLHGWPQFKVGEVGSWPGQYMASADKFEVKIIGKGGHGCRPYKAINPIVAASQIVGALQSIVSNEINTFDAAVITICKFNAGSAFNIIPDDVVLEGTVRTLDENVRLDIRQRMERTISGIASSFNCKYEFNYTFEVSCLIDTPEVVEDLLKAANDSLGEGHIRALTGPTMGAEDFSNYVNYIGKGALLRLGLTNPGEKELVLHNGGFDFNDEALPIGIASLVQYVLNTNK